MFEFILPAIISGIVGLIGTGVGGWQNHANRKSQEEANEKNIELQREMNAQNQANQEITWQREDTAMQRKATDLAAAGLSPHLAAGGSGSPVSQPIRAEAAKVEAFQGNSNTTVSALSTLANIGYQMQQMKQAQAQTDYIKEQTESARLNNQSFDLRMTHLSKQNDMIDSNIAQVTQTLENLKHNYNYAVDHGLPIGQSDVLIKRLEYALDKLSMLKDSYGGVLSSMVQSFGNKAKDLTSDVVESPVGSTYLNFLKNTPIGFLGGKALDYFKSREFYRDLRKY